MFLRLGRPPHLIQRIMDCVLILFQRRLDLVTQDPEKAAVKPSWGESLKMMTETAFLNNLQNFNKDYHQCAKDINYLGLKCIHIDIVSIDGIVNEGSL